MKSESWQMTEKMYAIEACRKTQQEEEADNEEDKVIPYFFEKALRPSYDQFFTAETIEEKQARL